MHHYAQKITIAALTLTALSGSFSVNASSSGAVRPLTEFHNGQPYLLAQGHVATTIGNYMVDINATTKRCANDDRPELTTNITGVNVYGALQAIEGVHNTLTLDPTTYVISGSASAPVNIVGARDNGATISWQIWCKDNAVA
tara:strand:+ start:358 stop:783 length:426 start_codon:yes stop_codon:yes gene_type:complete